MDRELLDLDAGIVESLEQAPQRGDACRRWAPARTSLSSSRDGAVDETARPRAGRSEVGELQPDVAARDAPLELLRGALGDDPAVVEDRDPVGELVGLVEVLGGEEDRDPARRPARGCCPTSCAGCAGRGRSSARRGRSPAESRPASSPGRAGAASRPSRSTPACRAASARSNRSSRLGDPLPSRRRGRDGSGRPSTAGSPRRSAARRPPRTGR